MLRAPGGAAHACTRCASAWPPATTAKSINFSFVEPAWEADLAGEANPIRLLNPIASQQSVMRTSADRFAASQTIRYNHARKVPRIRVFEVGRVFLRDPAAPDGPLAVAGAAPADAHRGGRARPAAPDDQWDESPRGVDFFDVKADLEALCRAARCCASSRAAPGPPPGRSARILVER